MTSSIDLDAFIARWAASGAAERANFQSFANELCDLLGVAKPLPAGGDAAADAYVFEKPVPLAHGTTGFIDLYRRGCFVMEAKQGSAPPRPVGEGGGEGLSSPDPKTLSLTLSQAAREPAPRGKKKRGTAVRGTAGWDTALDRARAQAQTYARSLPPAEVDGGRPPFLLIVDVGHTIDLYAEFTRSGGNYAPFPDPAGFRLRLADLRHESVRDLLRAVWNAPLSLDPARRSARVTRAIAGRLAELARTLEQNHDADTVAHFLMRCLFTMFAEDVGLLPEGAFTQLLAELQQDPAGFQPLVEHLWHSMNAGGYSVALRRRIPRFNGGLFADPTALPLDAAQIALLSDAARADWRDVEPAIFGTLLERALDPQERHKLGAHYTPRAYVERLVEPAVIAPLRAEWESVQAAALRHHETGRDDDALAEVEGFLHRLAHVTVLDPACGSGNFLYVTLEQMKRLEGEALNLQRDLGGAPRLALEGFTVTPQQFRGIEVNPRAAAIAELVLWIGYLQWHRRTRGEVVPAEPIIRDFHNIERRDAVLAWDDVTPLIGPDGRVVTRWDGRTTKRHPATGEAVPDETAQTPVWRYVNPRPAEWPAADFIVGNPPFIANRNLRAELGDGYVDALQTAYPTIREATDFVMYFWYLAADKVINTETRRFGLITTNSIRMMQNQGVVLRAIEKGARIVLAIPDHPWPGESDDAKVRVSMMVVGNRSWEIGPASLVLAPGHDTVATNRGGEIETSNYIILTRTEIPADLSPSVDTKGVVELQAWSGLCHAGMKPYSEKLIITEAEAVALFNDEVALGLHAPPYRNGSDVARQPRGVRVLDFFGKTIDEIRGLYPEAYQYLLVNVKPERSVVRNPRLREEWWLFEANRPQLRSALSGLNRYIVTVENSPQRYFVFLDSNILPDQKLRVIPADDAYILGVLSTSIHAIFALRLGGRQGVANTPVYNTRCCTSFPFPDASDAQRAAIRALAEQLDAHRKRQQALHPRLTLTDMYNVLEKLRAGAALNEAERRVHEQGLVAVLRQLHDELDAAVLAAYGWDDLKIDGTTDYTDSTDSKEESVKSVKSVVSSSSEIILERLVALNTERAGEEARGVVRWLRPAYQLPRAGAAVAAQPALIDAAAGGAPAAAAAPPWPARLADQAAAVRAVLTALGRPATAAEVAAAFAGRVDNKRRAAVAELLPTLAALGQARPTGDNQFVGV